jgi:hypothetical protein
MNTTVVEVPKGSESLKLAPWWVRAIFVALALVAWFWTQSLIGSRAFPPGVIGDGMHTALAPVHQYLFTHDGPANLLLIVSSALIDALGIFLLASGVFGPTLRPFLGLVVLLGLRQVCQALCALPPPENMIWRYPGFPSLLVTYGVSNDLFFSGHTATAVFGAIELGRLGKRGLGAIGGAIAVFEAITVLALRAHYTMDVFTGAVTALLIAGFATRIAPPCDRTLARLFNRS